jgi:hypothetical protein
MNMNFDGSKIVIYNGSVIKVYSTGVGAGAPDIIPEDSDYT